MILKHFLYLHERMLDGFVSELEGGRVESRDERRGRTRTGDASAGFGGVKFGGALGGSAETSSRSVDTPESRFERFMSLAQNHPDVEWVTTYEAGVLSDIETGAVLEVHADWQIPEQFRFLLPGVADQAHDATNIVLGLVRSFGALMGNEGRAKIEQLEQLAAVTDALKQTAAVMPKLPVIGVVDGWNVVGRLDSKWLREGNVDETAVLVGKVQRTWPSGARERLLDVPQVPSIGGIEPPDPMRAEARRARRELEGPGVKVDVLAIYR